MRKSICLVLSLLFLLYGVVPVAMAQAVSLDCDTLRIYFTMGSSLIDTSYRQNKATLDTIALFASRHLSDSSFTRPQPIKIVGTASPVGTWYANQQLSQDRANVLKEYIQSKLACDDSSFCLLSKGEDWERLRELVAHSQMSNKNQVLHIIDDVPVMQGCEYQLMCLNGGTTYRQMMDDFFPSLQQVAYLHVKNRARIGAMPLVMSKAKCEVNDNRRLGINGFLSDRLKSVAGERFLSKANEKASNALRPKWMVSTNMIYWAALAPNVGLEYCMANGRWSMNGEFFSPWWSCDDKHKYYQIRQYSLEGRYWFRPDHLFTRHFAGIYVHGGLYDLENGDNGYQGYFTGGGVTYGYVWAFRTHFRLELSLGAGYLNTEYKEYKPIDTHYVYQQTVRSTYWGPTKAKFGLSWIFVSR